MQRSRPRRTGAPARTAFIFFALISLSLSGCGSKPDSSTVSNTAAGPAGNVDASINIGDDATQEPVVLEQATAEQVETFRLRAKEAVALARDFRHEDAGQVLTDFLKTITGTTLEPRVNNLIRLISEDLDLFMILTNRMPLPDGKELAVQSPDGKPWKVHAITHKALILKTGDDLFKRVTWDQVPPRTQYEIIGRLTDHQRAREQLRLCVFCFLRGLNDEMNNELNAAVTTIGYAQPAVKQMVRILKSYNDVNGVVSAPLSADEPAFNIEPADFSDMTDANVVVVKNGERQTPSASALPHSPAAPDMTSTTVPPTSAEPVSPDTPDVSSSQLNDAVMNPPDIGIDATFPGDDSLLESSVIDKSDGLRALKKLNIAGEIKTGADEDSGDTAPAKMSGSGGGSGKGAGTGSGKVIQMPPVDVNPNEDDIPTLE